MGDLYNLKKGVAETTDLKDVVATAAEVNQLSGTTIPAGVVLSGSLVKVSETVAFGDFTDGGAAVGTIDLTDDIPIGAWVLAVLCTALTGFAGDTSAVVQIGDGTDVDRYNTGTPDVFSDAANGVALGAPSGVQYHATAKTVTVTVTTNADFTSVSAGSVTLELYYLT